MNVQQRYRISSEPVVEKSSNGAAAKQSWPLPIEEAFLEEYLSYVFGTYSDQIIFGPLIEGAAYEWTCPCAPQAIRLFDGYLTVNFGGPHFHLCIGEIKGSPEDPVPDDVNTRRRPAKAQMFRRLDKDGAPISWGFEMENGAGAPMISIFFANPFLLSGDRISPEPQWEKLAMWRDLAMRYLGREPEAFDESGRGFRGDHG